MSLLQRRQGHAQHLPLVTTEIPQQDRPSPRTPRTTTQSLRDEEGRDLIIMGYQHLLCFVAFMYALLMIGNIGFGWSPGQKSFGNAPEVLMVPIDHDKVTVVTAYFDIPSKRPTSEYASWIRHMMLVEDNMIMFCEPDLIHVFQELRQDRPTHFVPTTLNETLLVKEYGMDFWDQQSNLEPGKLHHQSKELYVYRNEKGHFLEQAMEMDAFPTPNKSFDESFFAWIDLAYLRNNLLDYKRLIRYLPKPLRQDQAVLLDIHHFVKHDYLSGDFIGGYKKGLKRWIREYYKTLEANRHQFLGNDRSSMYQTCESNKKSGLCYMVASNERYGDASFHMAPYLHGVQYWGILDRLNVFGKSRCFGCCGGGRLNQDLTFQH